MAYPTCLKLGKRKANSERSTYIYFLSRTAEGERAQGGVSSCLDPPRSSEGFLTAPPSGDVTPTAPHEQALVSLETAISQQVHQPIAELLLADSHPDSLAVLAEAVPQLSAPDRPNCEAEASQMEMSPASTVGERGGGAAALDTVRDGKLTIKAFIFLVCLLKCFLRMKSVLYLLPTAAPNRLLIFKNAVHQVCCVLFITHTMVNFITYILSVISISGFLKIFLVIVIPKKTVTTSVCGERNNIYALSLNTVCSYSSASLSPDIAENSEPVPVVSQLEGSPMDTSSPASATQEEPAPSSAQANHMSRELSGSGESGLTDRQTDADTG